MNYITLICNYVRYKSYLKFKFGLYKSFNLNTMKTIFFSALALLLSLNNFSQNKNTQTEIKTTTTTVKDSDGEKQMIKTEEVKEIQNIELKEAQPNTLNIEMKDSPVEVTATTKVNIDGVSRTIDIDQSAYYNLNGEKYQVAIDKSGYTMTMPNKKNSAVLRKTSNNNYIYRNKNKVSVGFFDTDGNLILETYDEKTDSILVEKFNLQK